MTPKQQTLLSLDIASSILQLRKSWWDSVPWNKKAIKLMVQKSNSPNQPIIHPFVEQAIDDTQKKKQDVMVSSDPQAALLELAILLLEIWHHKTLEMWVEMASMEKMESLEARHIAAIRWLKKTSQRLPPDHLTAIEECLAIYSGRLYSWDDSVFQKRYCENIIKPLQKNTKAW